MLNRRSLGLGLLVENLAIKLYLTGTHYIVPDAAWLILANDTVGWAVYFRRGFTLMSQACDICLENYGIAGTNERLPDKSDQVGKDRLG